MRRSSSSSPGQPLVFHLAAGRVADQLDEAARRRSGRTARTLVKEGPLRVTLIGLSTGGALARHRAEGPITVHVLRGSIRFAVADDAWALAAGDVLSLPGGVEHEVESLEGAEFLVTVARDG